MMDIQKEREAFEAWLFREYPNAKDFMIVYRPDENIYEHRPTQVRWEAWQAAKAQAVPEGFVLVPHGVLDLTRFMCKTWSEIDKFVYKNCSDIGQYPVIQGTQNQLNLSRIGEQQINANEINKGVNWLLEAALEQAND